MTKLSLDAAGDLARTVLGRVSDLDVRVAALNLVAAPQLHAGVQLRTDTSLFLGVNLVDDGVVCVSRYEVTAEPVETTEFEVEDDEDRWSVAVEVHGYWTLESIDGLGEENAQAFALAVGSMALHPYARTQIQSLVTAGGYPAYTLSVLHSLMEPDPEDGLVDLDQVVYLRPE